jgi:hypothetical protein
LGGFFFIIVLKTSNLFPSLFEGIAVAVLIEERRRRKNGWEKEGLEQGSSFDRSAVITPNLFRRVTKNIRHVALQQRCALNDPNRILSFVTRNPKDSGDTTKRWATPTSPPSREGMKGISTKADQQTRR